MQKATATFNVWFEETTVRFRAITVFMAIISTLLTAILFLQVSFAKVKTMPVQRNTQEPAPNIIFILADALSVSDMSMFGYSLPTTPNLEKMAQTWTVYSNTYSPLTCTVAGLPTFMTGRYTLTNKFYYYGNAIASEPGWLSVPNALEQAGYQTWWTGYQPTGFYHMGSVFEKNVCRSNNPLFVTLSRSSFRARAISKSHFPFIPFTLEKFGFIEAGHTDFDKCAELDPLAELLQKNEASSPFFIYYHYRGTHGIPYHSGKHLGAFLPKSEDLISEEEQKKVYPVYDPQKEQGIVDKLRLRYDEAMADQDQQLVDFIELLKKLGLYDSAMIIITSDHGQLFDDGYVTHCSPLVTNTEAHVPLLVKYPNQHKGQSFDFLASTLDLAPTILDVAGLEYPENWFDGVSLLKQASKPDLNRIVFTRKYDYDLRLGPYWIAATDGRFRFVKRRDQTFLFDISKDPQERVNLLEQNGYEQLPEVQRLKEALENYYQRADLLASRVAILSLPPLTP